MSTHRPVNAWRKSSQCTASNCVEVMADGQTVLVRDSKSGQVLGYAVDEWRAFVDGVKAGEFDGTTGE